MIHIARRATIISTSAAFMALSACSTPSAFYRVPVDGDIIQVVLRSDDSYTASFAERFMTAPRARLQLIKAIEQVSGCKVIPETIMGMATAIDADVQC